MRFYLNKNKNSNFFVISAMVFVQEVTHRNLCNAEERKKQRKSDAVIDSYELTFCYLEKSISPEGNNEESENLLEILKF